MDIIVKYLMSSKDNLMTHIHGYDVIPYFVFINSELYGNKAPFSNI